MTLVNLSFMVQYSRNFVEIYKDEFKNLLALITFYFIIGFVCFWVIFQNSSPTLFDQFFF